MPSHPCPALKEQASWVGQDLPAQKGPSPQVRGRQMCRGGSAQGSLESFSIA